MCRFSAEWDQGIPITVCYTVVFLVYILNTEISNDRDKIIILTFPVCSFGLVNVAVIYNKI